MPTFRTSGLEIFYEDKGQGVPVLLISGYGCDHTIWSFVAQGLAPHYRVICFDNRGIGRTKSADGPRNIVQMADDAAQLVEGLGLDSVHVVGHSMGGMIALELALARPELVHSLVAVSSAARFDARGSAIIEMWGNLPKLVDAATASRIILPWIYTDAFYARPGAIDQVIELIVSNPYPPSAETLFHQSLAIRGFDCLARLKNVACPTVVIAGKIDILVPPEASAELAVGIPNARLVVLEETGHGILIESPDIVTTAMQQAFRHADDVGD